MRILITNDDGILAPGLPDLVNWAKGKGTVTVACPKVEQSGKSHGIELHNAFEVKKVDLIPDVECYSVDSTPADCVRFMVLGLKKEFDLVISGINRGYNIGWDIMYSGTVSAVAEAVALEIPAIALSTSLKYYDSAAAHLDEVYDYFIQKQLMQKHNAYNINIPPQPKGLLITCQGGPYYTDEFPCIGGDLYQPKGVCIYEDKGKMELDTDAVTHGFISVMPLTINRTEWKIYELLKKE